MVHVTESNYSPQRERMIVMNFLKSKATLKTNLIFSSNDNFIPDEKLEQKMNLLKFSTQAWKINFASQELFGEKDSLENF